MEILKKGSLSSFKVEENYQRHSCLVLILAVAMIAVKSTKNDFFCTCHIEVNFVEDGSTLRKCYTRFHQFND